MENITDKLVINLVKYKKFKKKTDEIEKSRNREITPPLQPMSEIVSSSKSTN